MKTSDAYRTKREELRKAELELTSHRERVAALRRNLPLDTVVDDYVFVDAKDGKEVRLSELFTSPDRSLIIYHYMFGEAQTSPCPMCSMWIDGYDAVAQHVCQRADFAIVAAAGIDDLRDVAAKRGWTSIRLLSAGDSTFKRDFGSEDTDGGQREMITVFKRGHDGAARLFYRGTAQLDEKIFERGIDLLSPVWELFDLTPEGRGNWYPNLTY